MTTLYFYVGLVTVWAVILFAAYCLYLIFLLPLINAISVTALSVRACLVKKVEFKWSNVPAVIWHHYAHTFFMNSWTTSSIRSEHYEWRGTFNWKIIGVDDGR